MTTVLHPYLTPVRPAYIRPADWAHMPARARLLAHQRATRLSAAADLIPGDPGPEPPPKLSKTEERRQRVRELAVGGYTVQGVAHELGIKVDALLRQLSRWGDEGRKWREWMRANERAG